MKNSLIQIGLDHALRTKSCNATDLNIPDIGPLNTSCVNDLSFYVFHSTCSFAQYCMKLK